jgi:hypothetical protein
MVKAGFVTPRSTEEHARIVFAAVRHTLGPIMGEPFRFGKDLVVTKIAQLDWSVRERSEKPGVPRDALFLDRTSVGIYGLLCRLGCEDNWRDVVQDLLPTEPI